MTEDLRPTGVAGVPPDYFAADGQLWGNPLYAWERHAKEGYAWWLARLRASFQLYDVVRIDHFAALTNIVGFRPTPKTPAITAGKKGPASNCSRSFQKHFPEAKLVAEDLGVITEIGGRLVNQAGLPGMKILQFAFEGATEYLPHNCVPNKRSLPGTHE